MTIIFVLIAISIVIAGAFLVSFLYFAKNGQFDDTYTPSVRMLFDDEPPITKKVKEETNQNEKVNSQSDKSQ